ncbi:hypothetical protein A33M_1662 [Rhodovulum sp. PH10]|nr:hypothetical protein A33M_1662 [Rhodovulum sp. PH10]
MQRTALSEPGSTQGRTPRAGRAPHRLDRRPRDATSGR